MDAILALSSTGQRPLAIRGKGDARDLTGVSLEAAYFDADTVLDCLENLQCPPTNFGIFALGRRRAQRLHGGLADVLQSLGGCLALGELRAAQLLDEALDLGRIRAGGMNQNPGWQRG